MAPKITKVDDGGLAPTTGEAKVFVASGESKAQARKLRLISLLAWVVAIGFEIGAIWMLGKPPINTTWLVVLIVADLLFAIIGSVLWKKSNRLDPASQQDKVRFFVQNQLGLIIAVIAFLPLVILVFTNKNLSGKQKGIVGTIAVAALVLAGVTGVDLNPPSVEQYSEQTKQVEALNQGANHVYWTKHGKSYHLYSDCSYITGDKTVEIFEGTVAKARELKNITDLCNRCQARATKAKELGAK